MRKRFHIFHVIILYTTFIFFTFPVLPLQAAGRTPMMPIYGDLEVYETDDRYMMMPSAYSDVNYEVNQMVKLDRFLNSRGIHLLYVNIPTKYTNDEAFEALFGVETYANRNADTFLQRIREKGIPALDLRESARAEGLNIRKLFYRTDHHWNTPAALWGATNIARSLNAYCGYQIDPAIYDYSNFDIQVWEKSWLGEQGKKTSVAPVMEDFVCMKPKFPTKYSFKTPNGYLMDSFDRFVDERVYHTSDNPWADPSWHYSYYQLDCINHRVPKGNVLLLSDSYSQTLEPFLSLAVHSIDHLVIRDVRNKFPDFSLPAYIDAQRAAGNCYDTVIIAYGTYMIGARDDARQKANAQIFDLG